MGSWRHVKRKTSAHLQVKSKDSELTLDSKVRVCLLLFMNEAESLCFIYDTLCGTLKYTDHRQFAWSTALVRLSGSSPFLKPYTIEYVFTLCTRVCKNSKVKYYTVLYPIPFI